MHYWFDGTHMIWMAISSIVWTGLLVVLVWLFFSMFSGRSESNDSSETILRRRYAGGEINTEEFELRLEELRKTKNAA